MPHTDRPESSENTKQTTLIVDLDHTLCKSDTLSDLLALVVLRRPLQALLSFIVLFTGGRAKFKNALIKQMDLLSVKSLPYNSNVIDYIKSQREQARPVWLVTASRQELADQISQHLGIFDRAVGTSECNNLKGKKKLAYLTQHCQDGFAYIGDNRADLPIWKAANSIGIVATQSDINKFSKQADKTVEYSCVETRGKFTHWIKQLRMHQWSKNFLIFIPMILAQKFSVENAILAIIGFLTFGMVASSTYIINDILDVHADRMHPSKKNRPIAAGQIGASSALMFSLTALIALIAIAFSLTFSFGIVITAYLVLTLCYSFYLKRLALLDVFVIGLLFTARLYGGGGLLSIELSNWLIAFSMFLFPSLALAKRQGEIMRSKKSGSNKALLGRGYLTSDAELTLNLGVGGSIAALLLLMLYITNDTFASYHLYSAPDFLWLVPMVLMLWLGRVWLLAHRGMLKDDPVAFAIKDKMSLILGLCLGIIFILAVHGVSFS